MKCEKFVCKKFLVVFFAILYSQAFAQPQHYNWYFGFNAALSFANGAPVAISNSPLNTDEGVASISDSSGQILFYTNGEVVYDASSQVMSNGSGLIGSFTTSQSALIVPAYAQPSQYYLFTQGPQAGSSFSGNTFGGLSYSVVDMSLNNGLGAVTVKNVVLTDTTCEALGATSHANGKSAWVATHKWDSDAFYLYKVDCNGVNTVPVISNTGRMHTDTTVGNAGSLGCMKFSPDGTKLGIIWSQFTDEALSEARLDIFHFNNVNGKLTLLDTINFLSGPGLLERGYGIEFSPNGRFIYCSTFGLNNGTAFSHLYQLDLTQSNINNTKQLIASQFKAFGSLQRAPDGKIYIARLNGYQHLSALNFPDSLGPASQFVDLAVSLAGNYSTWGLPNNWNAYNPQDTFDIISFEDTVVCDYNPVTLIAKQPYNDFNYNFTWNNGHSGRLIMVTEPGLYTVTATDGCDTLVDSFVLNNETCDCKIEIPNIVTLNLDGLNDNFKFDIIDCIFVKFNISIFNRWGDEVFSSNESNFVFNPGTDGTYFYVAQYKLKSSPDVKQEVHKGFITVIRN